MNLEAQLKIEKLLKESIFEKDFHGMVLNCNERVEVFWWKDGSDIINKFWADLEISKPIIFSCTKGKLEINL